MEIWQFFVIFAIGVIAGFINTLAGGGSLLTLPMLIFMGLPATVANGTNRLAITVQSIFAVAGFRRKGISNFKLSLLLSAPALVGAVIGAQLSLSVSDTLFQRILAVIMLLVLGLILWDPVRRRRSSVQDNRDTTQLLCGNFKGGERRSSPLQIDTFCHSGRNEESHFSWNRRIAIIISLFFVGIYGGFIQAGIGFIVIAVLTMLGRLNLVETNSHKVFIIGINALFALFVFAYHSKISWPIGMALAAGNGLGGWLGSHLAVSKGERFIRVILAVCVIAMAVKLLV